jgi:hypothetical protein
MSVLFDGGAQSRGRPEYCPLESALASAFRVCSCNDTGIGRFLTRRFCRVTGIADAGADRGFDGTLHRSAFARTIPPRRWVAAEGVPESPPGARHRPPSQENLACGPRLSLE